MRHLNNGIDRRHSKSCCDQSSPARRTIKLCQNYNFGVVSDENFVNITSFPFQCNPDGYPKTPWIKKNNNNITRLNKIACILCGIYYTVHVPMWRINYRFSFHNSDNITSGYRDSQKQKHTFPHLGNGWHKNINHLQECWGNPMFSEMTAMLKGSFLVCMYKYKFTDNRFAIANSISKYPSYHLWKKKPSCLETVFGLRVYKPLVGLYVVMTRKGETPWFIKYDDKIMTLCHGNTFRITNPLCWASTGDHKRSVMRSFMFYLLLVSTSSWTNRRVVGDGIIENIGDLVKPLNFCTPSWNIPCQVIPY